MLKLSKVVLVILFPLIVWFSSSQLVYGSEVASCDLECEFVGGIDPLQPDVYALNIYVSFIDLLDYWVLPSWWEDLNISIEDFYETMSNDKHHVHMSTALRPAPVQHMCYIAYNPSSYYKGENTTDAYNKLGILNTEIFWKVYNDDNTAFNDIDMVFINLNVGSTDFFPGFSATAFLGTNFSFPYYEGLGTSQTFWSRDVLEWTIGHEYGHKLNLRHMFHTGHYALMNGWHYGGGICPYSLPHLIELDWIDVSQIEEVTYNREDERIKDIRAIDGSAYRIPIDESREEYFLIANHQQTGFDQMYSTKGLLIWHQKGHGNGHRNYWLE